MKKKLLGGLALALLLAGCGNSGSTDKEKTDDGKKTYKIGIIQQMEHPALDSAREGLEKYLKGKTDANFEITVKNAQGDNGTADTIAKQFVSDDVDLIYSIATNASQAAVNATGGTDIPVVFNAVTDGVEAKLVTSNEKPGGNVTGVSDAAPLEKQVEKLAPKYGFTVVKKGISATTEVATAAEQLSGDVDCIYNITDNMIVSATASITDKANAKKIPVFAAEDGQMKAGLLASDSISYEKLGEQAGSVVYDILVNGKKAGDIPVETAKDTTLYISKKVAEQLGIDIPDSLAERATFVEE